MRTFKVYIITIISLLFAQSSIAQHILSGQVYAPPIANYPVAGIMVETTSGRTTFTDDQGNFKIPFEESGDSLYFFLSNKRSEPFPLTIDNETNGYKIAYTTIETSITQLEIAEQEAYKKLGAGELEEVRVKTKNYHADSLADREAYAKYYNYKKPKLGLNLLGSPVTAVYNVLNVKQKKRNLRMQRNLLDNEQGGYVDSRFNYVSIRKYVGDQPDSVIDAYMMKYRPAYNDIVSMNELDLASYITTTFKKFEATKNNTNSKSGN